MKRLLLILIIISFLALGLCICLHITGAAPANKDEPSLLTEATVPSMADLKDNMPSPTDSEQDGSDTATTPSFESQLAAPLDDYLEMYAPVFRTYRLWLEGNEPVISGNTGRGDYYMDLGETGISFLCQYVHSLGYLLLDMDYNGIPELLIGSVDEHYETEIFDMFTLVDGITQRVIVSSERVYYKLCADQRILHCGSGGAAYNYCCIYHYDGSEIHLDYGVVMNDEEYYEIYQDRENIFDSMQLDDHAISREEYFAIVDTLETETAALDLISLNLYL